MPEELIDFTGVGPVDLRLFKEWEISLELVPN